MSQARRDAIEARDIVDIDALIAALKRHRQDVVQMAEHYLSIAQHEQAPHIFNYLQVVQGDLDSAGMMLAHARAWILPDDEDPQP